MKNYRVLCFLFLSSALSVRAATTLESGEFFVDLRESPRVSAGTETLTYSTCWAGADALAGCTRKARLAVAGYAGEEALEDVPVLVRLSTAIQGFDYNDFAAPVTGADLVFCDESETTVYPHEIDEWNTNGESLVWVRLPALAAGTAFKMGYGGTPATAADVSAAAHAVWSDYAGVWHMNEDSGTAFDSTANGLDGVPSKGTNTLADVSQMVAFENGACGRARVNATRTLVSGNHLTVPNYDSLHIGDTFVVSGWFHADGEDQIWPKLWWRNMKNGGWGVEFQTNTMSQINVIAGAKPYVNRIALPYSVTDDWTWICVAYQGTQVFCYHNGNLLTNATIVAVCDNGCELGFGSIPNSDYGATVEHAFCGQYDEIRLRGGTLSAARIRADYDMIANPGFVTCGAVEAASGVAVEIRLDGEVFAGPFAGEGTASWTPAKPGIYEFEHASLVDGTPVAVESASFEVPGPADDDLSIVAEGDLVEGVSVRLGGAPDGWTIHYTTDGSTPTADSPAYTGPFALAESATVKVVAVSGAHGWTTGVAEQRFDLAPPLAVTGARARQRYPWNGLVDVDFTLEGDAARRYRVSIEATDLDGGTNLLAATVWEDGGAVTNAALDLAPGEHRLVWNAGADLPEGFVADNVAVSLRAEYLHDTALYMVVDLSGGPNATRYPVSYLPDVPEGGWTDEYKTEKLVLRRVEPGTRETCGEPMFAAVFETTQGQFLNVMNSNPSEEIGDMRPVHVISYDDIRGDNLGSLWPASNSVDESSFLGRFRSRTGLLFDLPTDRQWEYACRAGTVTDYNNGGGNETDMRQVGRYSGNLSDGIGGYSEAHTTVGSYLPNAWQIYDMHGNVQERCLDWYGSASEMEQHPNGPVSGPGRVVRGGGFGAAASECRSSGRGYNEAPFKGSTSGFRLFLHNAPAVVEAPIVAPEGLTATTNRTGDVTLSWEPVSGAYAYQIRRSKTGAFEDGTWLNTVTNTTYADWTAEARTDYTYWVRAQFESGKVGKWSEGVEGCRSKRYTVRFHANGGTGTMGDLDLVFDQPQSLPANAFTKSGNVFAGWATNANGSALYANGETVENLSFEPGAVVTLYAVWASSSYTVKFNKNASAATGTMADQTMTRNASAALRANSFVRAGYKFAGWATSASGAKVYNDKQSVKNTTTGSTITLYAVWEALTAQNALYMVIDLSGGANASSYPVSYLSAVPSGGWTDTYKTTKLVLRRVEAGTFKMGGSVNVTLTKPFYIGIFEMTQKQYQLVTGSNPSHFSGDKRPMEQVSYNAIRGASNGALWPSSNAVDSSSFLGKLRARTRLDFDLPTEAQWEYACRAGTTTTYSYGNSANGNYMWCNSNSSDQTHEVGMKQPNPWGLYDMHGNVWDWCLDWYAASLGGGTDPKGSSSGSSRMLRGGSWYMTAASCTSSYRPKYYPSSGHYDIGFRLALTINE